MDVNLSMSNKNMQRRRHFNTWLRNARFTVHSRIRRQQSTVLKAWRGALMDREFHRRSLVFLKHQRNGIYSKWRDALKMRRWLQRSADDARLYSIKRSSFRKWRGLRFGVGNRGRKMNNSKKVTFVTDPLVRLINEPPSIRPVQPFNDLPSTVQQNTLQYNLPIPGQSTRSLGKRWMIDTPERPKPALPVLHGLDAMYNNANDQQSTPLAKKTMPFPTSGQQDLTPLANRVDSIV